MGCRLFFHISALKVDLKFAHLALAKLLDLLEIGGMYHRCEALSLIAHSFLTFDP